MHKVFFSKESTLYGKILETAVSFAGVTLLKINYSSWCWYNVTVFVRMLMQVPFVAEASIQD